MNPLFSLLIIFPIIILAFIVSKRSEPHKFRKYDNLDGLRGTASVAVFISHSSLFYFYGLNETWIFPTSNFGNSFYNQCGSGAVIIFFMMSSFLFYGKIKESEKIDWIRLYTSRVFRLFPIYYLSSVVGLIIVYTYRINNNFDIWNVISILTFRGVNDCFGINSVPLMTNGTAWTLPYEWTLYISLPLIWMITRKIKSFNELIIIIFSYVILISYINIARISYDLLAIFITGVIAYELTVFTKMQSIKTFAKSWKSSVIIVFMSFLVIYKTYFAGNNSLEPNGSMVWPSSLMIYSIIFIIIALGNDMFGFLTSSIARKIGEVSYSFYLLQFIFLWCTFEIITKNEVFSPVGHFAIAGICGVLLFLASNISFYVIERKSILFGNKVASLIDEKIKNRA